MLLKDFTIVDFSHRLPGPLGTNILGRLGAKVIKIEDEKFKDAFLSGLFSSFDKSFIDWYEGLNDHKEVLRLDFKAPETKEKIKEILSQADGVLMALPPKVEAALGLTRQELENYQTPLGVIYPMASKKYKESMHDLNAMARLGLLSLFLQGRSEQRVDPPFMPFSGIAFGQQIATDLLAATLQAKKQKKSVLGESYLYETAEAIYSPFWPTKDRETGRTKYLHNGAYPCYNLYRLKDGHYAGLAAVEEKFYLAADEIFSFGLPADKRFDTDDLAFEKIGNVFSKLTKKDVQEMIGERDLCLSIVEVQK